MSKGEGEYQAVYVVRVRCRYEGSGDGWWGGRAVLEGPGSWVPLAKAVCAGEDGETGIQDGKKIRLN